MSIGSIMQNLFGGQTTTTPPAIIPPTGAANPGQPMPGTQASPQTANNGLVPTQQPAQEPKQEPASPLDAYKDIWQTSTKPADQNNSALFANLDPAKVMESARKVDFTKSITPEQLTAINAGGPEAMQAVIQAMNAVAQTAYAQSAVATTKIVEQALAQSGQNNEAKFQAMIKKASTSEALLENNPAFQNPAVRPVAEALQEMLIQKNPNATKAEIATQVSDFFSAMGSTFAKPTQANATTSGQRKKDDMDWSTFL